MKYGNALSYFHQIRVQQCCKMSTFTSSRLHNGLKKANEKLSKELRTHSTSKVLKYKPPDWAQDLCGIPAMKLKLSNYNTPIHRWYLPGIPEDFEVYIKRDDLTGCSLSGNKARKLEFLLAEALESGCDSLIACGGMNSNFCRSLTAAGRELGFKSHLFLRSRSLNAEDRPVLGNLEMNFLLGADVYLVPIKSSYEKDILPRMQQLATHLRSNCNMAPYVIPIGGTCTTGLFGHIECFDELKRQGALEDYTDLVCTAGSGSSAAGFCIGNYLNESPMKIHAMAVCDDASYFHGEIMTLLKNVGLQKDGESGVQSADLIDIVEGVKGLGYGLSTEEELEFVLETAATTGIFLDPTYTGKAAYHMLKRMQTTPESFNGKKILFYNSGSVLGLMDGRMASLLESKDSFHNVHDWMSIDRFPLEST
ncbi:uncharacterized protein [Apostichopus japonicus]|uniref:uncharacterized protein isoform X2 n=1 Tax=Stichopus japonicus TaxID=307972 RepID=UPI003AB2AF4E